MPVTRMRMRPWLEKMIESNAIPGLSWIDGGKTMFQIPWKHAARHGWEMDKDACLFKKWAIHTGKYSEGQASDPKTWKANFRCAMNSLPDIEEVKDKSINKGHGAMRVFRMLPSTPKYKDKRSKGRESKSRKKSKVKTEDDTDYSDTHSPVSLPDETSSPQENTIDSTVQTDHEVCPFVGPNEVPEWTFTVEIGPDTLPSNFSHRFEVSPEHSPEYECPDIIEICKQLERDSDWRLSSDGIGFLGNEACNSPDSQWSDSSSELEDMRQYTTLCSNMADPATDELLSSFSQQLLSGFH